ncbi:DUF2949 domain-containing protein [Cytobacillus sp. NCCP-133]|uniref:DUF2949 domain-containing protein n=1 Tax=Cytobacillus sp. NCCP-133 TaxID=766848 RepID=UPI003FA42041
MPLSLFINGSIKSLHQLLQENFFLSIIYIAYSKRYGEKSKGLLPIPLKQTGLISLSFSEFLY